MGNYLMAFGALIIFSVFSLITNKSLINNKKVAMESSYIITATSLAQSVIEEAKTKAFDENTILGSISLKNSLSPYPLGPNSESVPSPDTLINNSFKSMSIFDDVDDYNNYYRIVNSPLSGKNYINVRVYYADSTAPYDSISGKSWNKKMTVTITNPFISIPVVQYYIFSYYK
jgi:hypothetical protein